MNTLTLRRSAHTRRWIRVLRGIGVGLALLLGGAPAIAQVVTTLADDVASPPAGSLRAALITANASGSAATVTFNIPGGGTVSLAGALPILRNPDGISIDGANAGQGAIVIDGGSSSATTGDRIFFLGVRGSDNTGLAATPGASWTITNLILQNGNARGGNGGNGGNDNYSGGGGGAGLGGALFVNEGSASVSNVQLLNNRATGGNGGILSGLSGSTGGGGGMGGNGGSATSIFTGGGGGGFGIGADGGNGGSLPAGAGSPGRWIGGNGGGAGAGTNGGAGGASGGGGGGSSDNQPAGGGGPGGEAGTTTGAPGGAGKGGNGAFGGGGGAGGGNNTQVGGSGGYGGGGGGSGAGDGGSGGFGGGGGGGAGSPIGTGGFAGGDGASGYRGGGGGAGLGGAVFVRQGATLAISGSSVSGGTVSGGSAGPNAGAGLGIGTAAFLAGSLEWSVPTGQTVTLGAGQTLGGGSDGEISGGLTKSGPGTLVLDSNNSYVGPTVVSAGQLQVNGNLLGTGAVSVASGATLSGSGTLSGATSVASGGTLAPGEGAPGRLNTANVTLAAGATFAAEITGATVATQYDQLDVTGTITLGGATLALSGGFVPSGGQSFVLIDNDGVDAVSGTFSGLAQGATVVFNGVNLSIDYAGGDGNDVVLDPCAAFVFPYTLAGADNTALVANLRQAIQCANANGAGADTINLDGQTVALPASDPFADYSGQTGLPQITSTITLRNGTLLHDLSGGGFLFRTFSIAAAGDLTLQDMELAGDSAPSPGGAFHNAGTLTVSRSTIHGYDTNNRAGVLHNASGATATISNSVLYDNNAVNAHAIDNYGVVTIINSTFDKHTSISNFGAVLEGTGYTLRNSIFWNPGSGPTQISASNTVSNSIVKGGYSGGTAVLDANPLFVNEAGNDFRLADASPAIDAGANADAAGLSTDLDGNPRRVNDTGVTDTGSGTAPIVDIGAFEKQTNSPLAADFSVTTTATTISVIDNNANGSTLVASEPVLDTLRFDAAGRTFSVNGGMPISGNSGTLALAGVTAITITASGGTSVATGTVLNVGGATFTSASAITLAGGTLKATGSTAVINAPIVLTADSDLIGSMALGGAISGSFTLRTFGAGTYRFDSTANSFARLIIGAGTVELGGDGTLPPEIDIFSSAGFNLNGFDQTIDFYAGAGNTQNTGAAATLSIGVAGSVSSFGTANYVGPISGPIALTYAATANQFMGSNSSTYTGATMVLGALRVSGSSALGASGAGNDAVVAASGSLDLRNVAYAANEAITVNGGTLATSLGTSSFPGTITLIGSAATINVVGELSLDGEVGGSQGFSKTGSGVLRLTQANSYTGPVSINGGSVLVTGSTAAASSVSVASGGTLGGTGVVNGAISVASGGTLAPGVTGGTLQTANVSLTAGATFAVGITGATAGTQYDQLDANGTVDLGGATLALSGAYVPSIGQSFVLIDNDGADAVIGTFNGLPNTTSLLFNGVNLHVNYAGGDGNDVVLTAVPPTTTVVSLNRASGNPRNTPTVTWTVTFAAPVDGLTPANFAPVATGLGGTPTVTSVTEASGPPATQWNVGVSTGSGSGTLGLNLVNDSGLTHTLTTLPFTGQVFDIDRTPPTVNITVADSDLSAGETSAVSFVFSEAVNALSLANITIENGTLSMPSSVDGITWTATLTPTADLIDPSNVITVDTSGSTDAAGNPGVGFATSNNYMVDTVGPTLSVADVSRVEGFNGQTGFDVEVSLSAPAPAGGVSFDIATADNTATAGSDYVARSFTSQVIAAGSSTYTLSVPVSGDAMQEPDETLFVNVTNITGATAGDLQGVVTIVNDDLAGITVSPTSGLVTTEAGGTATFTVVLTSQPTADVSIGVTSSDTTEGTVAPASLVFTGANWNVAQTVTVTGVDDLIADGDVAYTIVTAPATSADGNYDGINAADVSVSNSDNDTAGITVTPTAGLVTTEAGGTATFTVVLTSQPTADVTIGIASADTTEGAVAPASLVFTDATWNVPQTVTVTGVDDPSVDGSVAYTIVTAPATSADGNYDGLNVADVSVSNTDNDSPGVMITQTAGNTVVTEGGATDSYAVVLATQPASDVTVTVTPGSQLLATPASLLFTAANWNIAQTVSVSAVDDVVVEGDHGDALSHAVSSADVSYSGIAVAGVTVSITDNDSALVAFSPASVSQSESSPTMSFSVTLSNPVQSGVTVSVNSAFGSATTADFTPVVGGTVSFAPNSTTSQMVNMAISNDAVDEADETFSLTLSNLVATGNVSLGDAVATGTVLDDDPTPLLSISSPSQPEGSAGSTPLTFVVSLSTVSGRDVRFTRATADGTATVADNDYVPLAAALATIPAGQLSISIPVLINGDAVFEGDESFSLILSGIDNATPASLSGTGTITETDPQPTTTTITSDLPDPSVVGQPYTVNVTVDGQTLSPLGTVTVSDGSVSCGPITLTAGTAPTSTGSCQLTSTSAGAKTLTASYTPASGAFAASDDTEAHQVNAGATTLSVSGPSLSRIQQPTRFSFVLAVTAPGGETPSGIVTLSGGGASCQVTVPTATPSCELSFATAGAVTVSASYTPDDGDHLAATSSGAGNASTIVATAADLQLDKSDADAQAQPGGTVLYTLSYRNLGSLDATGVLLSETVPANTRFHQAMSSPGWSCADNAAAGTACSLAVGTLAAGAPASTSLFAVRVDAALADGVLALSNQASISDDGSNGAEATPGDNSDVEQTPIQASPDLSVSKSTAAAGFVPGQAVVYQLRYRNQGNRTATGVRVIETVPEDTVFVAASSTSGWSCADGAVGGTVCSWAVGNLAAGQEAMIEFAVTLRTGRVGGMIRNTVRVEDDGSNGPDPTPDNNASDVARSAPSAAPTVVPATGALGHLLLMLAVLLAAGLALPRPRQR